MTNSLQVKISFEYKMVSGVPKKMIQPYYALENAPYTTLGAVDWSDNGKVYLAPKRALKNLQKTSLPGSDVGIEEFTKKFMGIIISGEFQRKLHVFE
jgi:hypothetical protein